MSESRTSAKQMLEESHFDLEEVGKEMIEAIDEAQTRLDCMGTVR